MANRGGGADYFSSYCRPPGGGDLPGAGGSRGQQEREGGKMSNESV